MKNPFVNLAALLILVVTATGLQAQTTNQKPDQVKLLKQLEGTWQADLGKDTLLITVLKPFGTGLDGYATVKAKGKTISERRQLFGYDQKTDRFIEAEVTLGSDMELWVCWFTRDNQLVGVPYADRLTPEKSVMRIEIDIKSRDSYTQTVLQNGKRIGGRTMNRIKG